MPDIKYTGDAFIDNIINGGKKPNPQYNPKTKAGKQVPAYTIDTNPAPFKTGAGTTYANIASGLIYSNKDLGLSYKDVEDNAEHNIAMSRYLTEEDTNNAKAEKQRWYQQFGNFLVQTVGNEIVIGTVKGFSDLFDATYNFFTGDGTNDYTNPFSKSLEEAQDAIRKEFEIHRANPNKDFDLLDTGYIFDNAINIASTVSLMLPGYGATKAVSYLGKLTKLNKLSHNLSKMVAVKNAARYGDKLKNLSTTASREASTITNLRKTVSNASALERGVNEIANVGFNAFVSRTVENYQEAREVWKEQYDYNINYLNKLSRDEVAKFLNRNPQYKGMSKEEIAAHMAGLSADETFRNDYWMLLFDMAQIKGVNALWKGTPNMRTSAKTRIYAKNAAKKLQAGDKVVESELIKPTLINRAKETIKYAAKHPLYSAEALELSEGIEEGFQGIQTEKGKEISLMLLDPKYTSRTIGSYISDSNIWDQAFWGVLGGVGFQMVGKGFNKAHTNYKNARLKKKLNLSDEEFEKRNITIEKMQMAAIDGQVDLLNKYAQTMTQLNEQTDRGIKNPIEPIIKNGRKVNPDDTEYTEYLSKEEADTLKQQFTDEFILHLVTNAADAGTYDLFKEFIKSEDINKFFEQNGLNTEFDKELNRYIADKAEDIYNEYSNNVSDIFYNIKETESLVDTPYVVALMSRDITRRKLDIYNTNDRINNIERALSEQLKDANEQTLVASNLYRVKAEYQKVKKVIAELNKELSLKALSYSEGLISIQAYLEYEISAEKQIRNLLNNFISSSKLKLEKDALNNDSGDLQKILSDLIDSYDTSNLNENIKNTIDKIAEQKAELDFQQAFIPRTKNDFQHIYDEFKLAHDDYIKAKFQRAANAVGKYIQEAENPLQALQDIIYEEIEDSELKKKVDMLKLGHYTTKQYYDYIRTIAHEEVRKRQEEATPRVDGDAINETQANRINEQNSASVAESEQQLAKEETEENTNETENTEGQTENNEGNPSTGEEINTNTTNTSTNNNTNTNTNTNGNNNTSNNVEPEIADEATPPVEGGESEEIADETALANETEIVTYSDDVMFFDEFTPDPFSVAYSIAAELYRKTNFEGVKPDDINNAQFNNLVKQIADKLVETLGCNEQFAIDSTRKAIVCLYQFISNVNNEKGDKSKANLFANYALALADRYSYIIDNIFYVNTTPVKVDWNNEQQRRELIEQIENLFESYLDKYKDKGKRIRKRNGLPIVNLNMLFNELLNDKNIPLETVIAIHNKIKLYVKLIGLNGEQQKYIFTGVKNFNKRATTFLQYVREITTVTPISKHLHTKVTTNVKKEGEEGNVPTLKEILDKIKPGSVVKINWTKGVENNSSLSITIDGIEIAFTSSITVDSENNVFRRKKVVSGFNYAVWSTNGNYQSNVDSFFYKLIDSSEESNEYTKLLFTVDRYATAMLNGESFNLSEEEIDEVYKIIEQLASNGIYKIKDDLNKKFTVNKFIKEISNVIFYDNTIQTVDDVKRSYDNWKSSIYTNYKQTYEAQTKLLDGEDVTATITEISGDKANTVVPFMNSTNKPISSLLENGTLAAGTLKGTKPRLAIIKDGQIMFEDGTPSISNTLPFTTGTMGFVIEERNGNPIIAPFSDNSSINGTEIGNQVKTEINSLLKGFHEGTITYDEITNSFKNLFGKKGNNGSYLLNGYYCYEKDGKFMLISSKTNEAVLIIHKYRAGSNVIGTGVSYISNKKVKATYKYNSALTANIGSEIVKNSKFNKTFYTFNTKEDNESSNKYIQKRNGKLVIKVGGVETEYDNFADFIIKNDAFVTKQGMQNGSYFETPDNPTSVYLNVQSTKTEIETPATTPEQVIENAKDYEGKETYEEQEDSNTKQLLESSMRYDPTNTYTQEMIDILFGNNEAGITLIPKHFYKRARGAFAAYSKTKKRVYINSSVKGTKTSDLVRLLMHEELHHKLHENHTLEEQEEIIDGLIRTYETFVEAIEKDSADVTSKNHELAVTLKSWVESNKFDLEGYFTKNETKNTPKKNRRAVFAEEWLVESLSQKEIMRYLNDTIYEGEEINIDGIEEENKTLFQKIIDLILKIFKINDGKLKNNTILAKQFMLLGNNTISENNNENINENTTEETENTEENENAESEKDNYLDLNGMEEDIDDDMQDIPSDDELSNATTTTVEEVRIEAQNKDVTINQHGVMKIETMDKFLNTFPLQDRENLRSMMNKNLINYFCR